MKLNLSAIKAAAQAELTNNTYTWIAPNHVLNMVEELERLQPALQAIAGLGSVDLSGEWEGGLRDIIRSMTDCAKTALSPPQGPKP